MKHWMVVVAALVLGGCQLLSDGDDAARSDWLIAQPDDLEYEPGERLALDIQGVDVEWSELRIWLDDTPWQIHSTGVVGVGDPDTIADDRIRVNDFVMTAIPGAHTLAVGDTTGPRTPILDIQLVIPAPRLSHDAMAELLREGTRTMVTTVRDVLADSDPSVASMFEHSLGAANREQALALLDELAPIGELMAEQYLALSPDDAAVFQAVLHNVGLVDAYSELLAPVQARRPEVITIYDRLTHPAARALFYLDLTSSALGSLGDVVMVVNILSMLGPGTQAWAPIGMTAKIAIAVIRVVLDSIVPTDLVALEGQTQPWLYSNEGAQWLYWGTFEPQNGLGGTVQSIIEQAASIALPTKLKVDAEVKAMLGEVGEKVFKDVMTRIATRFPSLVARWTLTFDSARLDRVKLIVNMQAYDLTIGDLAQLVPLFGASLASIRWLIDFEVVSPYSLEAVDSWAEDAAIEIEYSTDTFGIDGIAWPQGAKETNFQVKATGYAWRNQNVILLSVPWPQWQELTVPVRVMKQPEGQNMHIAYEAFVVTHGTPGATSEDAIWSSAPTARSVRMRFFDEHHEYEGLATFEVLVNGSSLGGFVLPDGDWTESNIAMSPGLNTVTIRATRGHSGPHTYPFAMSLTVPESTNVEKRREIGLQVGGTFEFQVYVPPAFPSQ